jgi:hypothetical protein
VLNFKVLLPECLLECQSISMCTSPLMSLVLNTYVSKYFTAYEKFISIVRSEVRLGRSLETWTLTVQIKGEEEFISFHSFYSRMKEFKDIKRLYFVQNSEDCFDSHLMTLFQLQRILAYMRWDYEQWNVKDWRRSRHRIHHSNWRNPRGTSFKIVSSSDRLRTR